MKGLIIILTTFLSASSFSQEGVFNLQNKVSFRIPMDTVISNHTELELFYSENSISGLAFSGEITLNSDSSLVRMILQDKRYDEYLIYETFPVLAGTSKLSIFEIGEETSLLSNIIPTRVIIDIIDASVHLKEFVLSEPVVYKATAEAKDERYHLQTKIKIERINQNIQALNQKWVAGETSVSKLSYQEKKKLFGGRVPNFQGFEYYRGGYFELPDSRYNVLKSAESSEEAHMPGEAIFVKEFSWRNRHGKDWVTPVKHQGACGSCWAFASVAGTELMVNLYFNQQLNLDLSEQNLISCTQGSCERGGFINFALDYIMQPGIVPEECLPYSATDEPCSLLCNDPSDLIRISGFHLLKDRDEIKQEIMNSAVVASVSSWHHTLSVTGFRVIEEGDSINVYHGTTYSSLLIKSGDPLIGKTAWQCKNSWGSEWGDDGYVYLVDNYLDIYMDSFEGPVLSTILDSTDILCVDEDDDGYYTWGNGTKPAHCPVCPPEADGDDSNPCIGPMDDYGILAYVTISPESDKEYAIFGADIPTLFVEGSDICWYSDRNLEHIVHTGNSWSTGIQDVGTYKWYVTQTVSGCESDASIISLSIFKEVPRPIVSDQMVYEGEVCTMSAKGESGATFSWYADSLRSLLLYEGDTFQIIKSEQGIYTFYVTQAFEGFVSDPEPVTLTVVKDNFVCGDSILYKGQYYGTVYIGSQCWFSENLNIGMRIGLDQLQTDNGVIEKYCYDDEEDNCESFGGLYSWHEYIDYSEDTVNIQGVCPDGWTVHSDADWKTLELYIGVPASDLDNLSGERGIGLGDKLLEGGPYGFNALCAGLGNPNTNPYYAERGYAANFWSSIYSDTAFNYLRRQIPRDYNHISRYGSNRNIGLSVRCVKNMPFSELNLDYQKSDVSCYGGNDGEIHLMVTGGLGPYSYNWSTGASTKDISNLAPGQYIINVADAENNSMTDTIEIHEPVQVPKPITYDTTICQKDSEYCLYVPGENISWYGNATSKNPISIGNTLSIGELQVGIHTFFVTRKIGGCESDPDSIMLEINPTPAKPETSDKTVCETDTIPPLTASGDSLRWYSDVGKIMLVYEGDTFHTEHTVPGVYRYYVTQTRGNCESRSDSVTLTIKPIPEIDLGTDTTIYTDQNLILLVYKEGYEYLWSNGTNTPYLEFSGSDSIPGIYEVSLRVSYNGCFAYDTLSIEVDGASIAQTEFINPPLEIFPNPATDRLIVRSDYDDSFNLQISSVKGLILYHKEMEDSSYQIDLSALQKGVYFITIRSKDFVTTRKIIKL